MKVLFAVIPEKGHINPYIGPALHLQERGHVVAFHARFDILEQLQRAGIGHFLGGTDRPPPPSASRGAEFAEQVRDRETLRRWIRELIVDSVPEQVKSLAEAVAQWRPDVIVADPMVYGAAIVAWHHGIPWAAVSNSLNPVLPDDMESELLDTLRRLDPDRRALFAGYGVPMSFRGCDMLSPDLTVAFTTREFIGRDVPGVRMVGPSLPPRCRGDEPAFPWSELRDDRRIVYMSFGSQIYYQPRMFQTVIDATAERHVQLILAVGELVDTDELKLGDHVLAVRYAPQLQLLPRTSVLITHGGANSVMESLHFGVPILISPLCNDQFHQSRLIEERGVGIRLDLSTASVEDCGRAIDQLLRPGPFRHGAARIARSYQADGSAATASLIEQLERRC